MTKNFDVERQARMERDRSFEIGGKTFAYRPTVAPEALLPWENRGEAEGQAWLDILDATVLAFLEPGQEDLWREVRSPDAANPLNVNDILDVIVWLFEEQTARPTGPPSASSPTPAANGTTSTDDSSPPDTPEESSPSTSEDSSTTSTPS